MKQTMLLAVATAMLVCGGAWAMDVASTNMANGASLALDQVKNGCGGKNISPALSWSGAPPATQSFAVTAFDPDAHGGWWHWTVVDIPAAVQSLPTGAGSGGTGLPQDAVQGVNDFGDASYGGACPPPGSGPHHYEFTVWALSAAGVPFAGNAKSEDIAVYLKAHAIAHAQLVAIYQR
jgi:Raf kinase inhibitor-like YbhB/YbcL family protein